MKNLLLEWSLVSALMVLPLHAENRTWTNTEGVKIQAEFVKAEGDSVTLRLPNGKVTTFPQTKLSEADRDFIKKSQEEGANVEAKAEPSLQSDRKAKWLKKMDKATEEAKETGLPILVLFTGTSWCPYCVQLEDEVFSKKDFKNFANQNLVLLKLEFGPGGSAQNRKDDELQKKFGVKGFPSYFLTDGEGKPLANGGYHKGISPKSFADWVKNSAPKKQ